MVSAYEKNPYYEIKNTVRDFISSDYFIITYAIFVYGFSFIKRGDITLSFVMLIFAAIFFTQKDLKPVFVPFVMCYFAFPFLLGGTFKFGWLAYVSLTVFICSVFYYIMYNKPKMKLTRNLIFLLPYAIAYPLGGLFTAGYIKNGIYLQSLGLLALISLAMVFFAFLAGNSDLRDKTYAIKVLFTLGVVISAQIFTRSLSPEYWEIVKASDTCFLNWGIYNGVVTVMLITIPACFYLAVKSPRMSFVYVLVAAAEMFATFLTASRAAIAFMPVHFLCCVVATFFVFPKAHRKTYFSALSVTIILIFLTLLAIYLHSPEKIANMFSGIKNSGLIDGNGRESIWRRSWNYFKESPAFGKGFFHDSDEQLGATGGFWLSHNTVLQSLSSLGIVGFLTLALHTYMKYKSCCVKNDVFCFFALMIFIGTECYGMIDCVMPAPYYLLPLILILLTLDANYKSPLRKSKLYKTKNPD